MKTIVVYTSQTGFTKRYAEWIAETVGADCYELSEAKKLDLDTYEAIVYGGWALAGTISKLGWFKSNLEKWKGKKLIAFCVGGSPLENPEIMPELQKNFTEAELETVKIFYCPGGFNYEKMSGTSKVMMKMFIQMNKAKKNKTEQDKEMIRLISSSYDITDKKYIEPILEYLNEGN